MVFFSRSSFEGVIRSLGQVGLVVFAVSMIALIGFHRHFAQIDSFFRTQPHTTTGIVACLGILGMVYMIGSLLLAAVDAGLYLWKECRASLTDDHTS